jgi:hypothetical protein
MQKFSTERAWANEFRVAIADSARADLHIAERFDRPVLYGSLPDPTVAPNGHTTPLANQRLPVRKNFWTFLQFVFDLIFHITEVRYR